MFHFPAFPPRTLCVQVRVTAHDDCRVSPFGHPRITARLTAPRGLSRPPTSFIGSWCQGIHRVPFITWPQMLASTVQFSNNDRSPAPHPPPGGPVPGPAPKGTRPGGRALRHPTARPTPSPPALPFHAEAVLRRPAGQVRRVVNVPPMSHQHRTCAGVLASDQPEAGKKCSLERR